MHFLGPNHLPLKAIYWIYLSLLARLSNNCEYLGTLVCPGQWHVRTQLLCLCLYKQCHMTTCDLNSLYLKFDKMAPFFKTARVSTKFMPSQINFLQLQLYFSGR